MSLSVKLLLAALGGGSVWKIVSWVIDYAGLRKSAQDKFRNDLLARVKALQERVDNLESALADEQRARVRAELRAEMLDRRIEMLVEELNRLREEQGMEPLDPAEYKVSEIPLENEESPHQPPVD